MERTKMERKPYSAGAVKFSFWFMEFRKTVQLLSEGKSFADIKKLNEEINIYGAPTKLRAQQIYSTVTARIKTLDESFYPIFLSSDLATQKLFVLTAALLHDSSSLSFRRQRRRQISGYFSKINRNRVRKWLLFKTIRCAVSVPAIRHSFMKQDF